MHLAFKKLFHNPWQGIRLHWRCFNRSTRHALSIVMQEATSAHLTGKLDFIGSDNGRSSVWHQALIWTRVDLVLTGQLKTHFRDMSIKVRRVLSETAFENIACKMTAPWSRPQCNVICMTYIRASNTRLYMGVSWVLWLQITDFVYCN